MWRACSGLWVPAPCRRCGPLLTAQGTGRFRFLGWSLGDFQVSGGPGERSFWTFPGRVFIGSLTCSRARKVGAPAPHAAVFLPWMVGAREARCFAETGRNSGAQDVAAWRASLTSLEDWVC